MPRRVHARNLIAAILLLLATLAAGRADDAHPLRPIATGSPRQTLTGFITVMDQLYGILGAIIQDYTASDRLYLNASERALQRQAAAIAPSALGLLDTSHISPILHDTVTIERALMLKSILDRIDLPAAADIPDTEQMKRTGEKKWRIPDTEIDITLIDTGPRAGEYLFSAETVDRLPEFFERIRNLPDHSATTTALREAILRLNPNVPATVYDAWQSSPTALGFIVPPRWLLGAPAWVKTPVAGLAPWQWTGLLLGLAIATGLIVLAHRIGRRFHRHRWAALSLPLALMITTGLLLPAVFILFRISGQIRVALGTLQTATLYLSAAVTCMVAAVIISEIAIASEHLQARSLDSQLIRLGARLCGLIAATICLIHGADQLGLPAYSIVAGLGVGGLAVALAARDSVANLFGSMLIMFEKPFRVGHYVRVAGTEGTVEDVGFRSTRLRTKESSLITIPNDSVINAKVENMTVRAFRRQQFLIQLTYATTLPQLDRLLNTIRDLLADHPAVDTAGKHVRFNDFGESSLNVLVIFHLMTAEYAQELQYREEILMDIMRQVTALGLDFAFPTRTVLIEPSPAAAPCVNALAHAGA